MTPEEMVKMMMEGMEVEMMMMMMMTEEMEMMMGVNSS